MASPSRLRARGFLRPGVRLLLFGVAVTMLGCLGAVIRPADGAPALWWPGAGVAVAGLLVARPRQRPAVVLVLVLAGTLSGLYGGRPLLVAALLALVNTVGAVVVLVVLGYRRPDPRALRSLPDLMRVLQAALLGGATAGITAGIVVTGLLDLGFVASAATVAASHAAAVVLLLPFVLHASPAPVEATTRELVAQWAMTAFVTLLVFAPGQRLPLVFLLLPALLWPALRSSLRANMVNLLTVGLLASVLTLRGGGPFPWSGAALGSDRIAIALVQLLAITSVTVTLAVFVAVSQRRSLLLATSRREELFRVGFTESLLGLLLLRPEQDGLHIVELNGVAARLLDGHPDQLIGSVWCATFDDADRQRVRAAVASLASDGIPGWHGEIHLTATSNDRWVEVSISPAVEGTSVGDLLTVQMVDVTARRAAEAHLTDLALRDGLTGVANRMLLTDRLELALAETTHSQLGVGVVFLDVDRFKAINDTYGHATGDLVLIELANRLLGATRDSDTVARIGGDEFVVVCPRLTGAPELAELHQRIQAAVSAPIMIGGSPRRLEASVGVTLGQAGSEARELLRRADADMYARKAASRLDPVQA